MSTLNKAQLLASFPDNIAGLILPVDLRNLVDSVELKYDNFTVVKPGQPVGNAFPAPVGGKIILPAGSAWAINGPVTINYPLHFEQGATLFALSGSYTTDALTLDASAGAVALINSGDTGSGTGLFSSIYNLTLDATAGTGRLFDLKSPNIFTASGCLFASLAFGSVDSTDVKSQINFIDCINLISGTALQLTGSNGGRLNIRGIGSGIANAGVQFDLLGNFDSVTICDCYNASLTAMFSASEASALSGVILGNTVAPGSPFISGVDATSVNWTFSGNSGISNTVPTGSLAVRGNATTTNLTAVNTWEAIAGTSSVAGTLCRFESPSDSVLKYVGKESFIGSLFLSVSLENPSVTTPYTYEVSIFKNGALLTDGGVDYVGSAIIPQSGKQVLTLSAPVSAITDDEFSAVVRSTDGTEDPIATDLTFVIR